MSVNQREIIDHPDRAYIETIINELAEGKMTEVKIDIHVLPSVPVDENNCYICCADCNLNVENYTEFVRRNQRRN